ncbi:sulfatase [Flavivirga abyssicola]|uniref:sulfatase n=1 Tax=Flavivirga abyssicola TaxID=3063533 RepID=UPI0026E09E83|nr:sulfatase [Flavivirga sp. MEBiC07777]WVK13756.1 sulfatase [Flavivirga sp. MEBiC07777]
MNNSIIKRVINMSIILLLLSLVSCASTKGNSNKVVDSSKIYTNDNKERPNILLIMVDDMNDWVGAFGGNQQAITPNMDALANKSVIFKNAYCSAALCNPSRTSLLTGYLPSTTGVYGNSEHFREIKGFENTVTLPQYFEQNGYKTAAAGKIFHSPRGQKKEPRPGSDPGSFQVERVGNIGADSPSKENKQTHGLELKKRGVKGSFIRSFDWYPVDVALEDNHDWKNADYCAQFLQQEHDKPFFVACGIFRPHLPWFAPKQFFDLYDLNDINIPETLKNDLDDVGNMGNNMAKKSVHQAVVEEGKWKEAVRAYLANLSFADACVGRVMDALNNSKYNENTIVVLMGDHGYHLGEKEHWSKNVLWERAAKTPLLIFDPRNEKERVSTRVVSLLDVYPTLVELCGLPKNEKVEGQSMATLLKDESANWNDWALTSKKKRMHSLRNEQYRYTVYPNGFEELYDHKNDPNEWCNIASNNANKAILKLFRKKLKDIIH